MKLNRSFNSACGEQKVFAFRADAGLPLAVSPRSIERAARREFVGLLSGDPFSARRYAEKLALLRQLRGRYRNAIRKNGGNAAAYAGTPEGRRVHRAIDELTLKIAEHKLP